MRDPSETTPVGTIYDAMTGATVGSFGGNNWMPIPALGTSAGYFSAAGTLRGQDLGSASGKVYALDAVSGSETWVGSAGAAIPAPDEQNVSQPLTGLGAGEGYLVVPAGSTLTAWRIAGP